MNGCSTVSPAETLKDREEHLRRHLAHAFETRAPHDVIRNIDIELAAIRRQIRSTETTPAPERIG